jgi:flagellin
MELSVNQASASLSILQRLEQEKENDEEKLASGKRINSAADDPAGLQIASRLTSEINSSQQLSINARDQINQNNVQAGGVNAINESLQRANELSVQSGNPLNDSAAIQGELDQLTEQINTIASETLGIDNFVSGLDANDPATSQQAIASASETLSETATSIGVESNALSSQAATYEAQVVNISASRSRIEDTDIAETSAEQQQNAILIQSAIISKKDEESRKGLLINQIV